MMLTILSPHPGATFTTGRNWTPAPTNSPRSPPSRPRGRPIRAFSSLESAPRKGRGGRGSTRDGVQEEDIYTIDGGWKVDIKPSDEKVEVAGLQVPVRLKQQLERERRSRSRKQVPVEDAAPPRTTHKLMRVMAGTVAGKKLTSSADLKVRPMMELVRGAVFNILQSFGGWSAADSGGRWLDLYSGTGSVAIEALSRGCVSEAHFVEMDPWVVANVLQPNLQDTNFGGLSTIHTSRVEAILEQVAQRGVEILGGPFDFLSVTPPYEAVSYTSLMAQLAASPLVRESSFMVVEYPLKSRHEMPERCGSLHRVRDRRYGRTFVAIYGPLWIDGSD